MRIAPAAVVALVLALLAAAPTWAFVLFAIEPEDPQPRVRWPVETMPVRFAVNDRPLVLLPNLSGSSTPLAAVEAALRTWSLPPMELVFDGPVATADRGRDSVNLITFADTARNREISSNAIASALTWFRRRGSQVHITESDIVFNPRKRFATDGDASAADIQAVLTHELGHALGLDHAPHIAATMFPRTSLGQTSMRTLEPDDRAGLRALYDGATGPDVGAISGRVRTVGGHLVFGAHVVAAGIDGVARVGVLTDRNGRFLIPSLPAGDYQVYVEPLDGPMTTGSLPYDYYHDSGYPVLTPFRTTFAGGNRTPSAIPVEVDKTTVLDPIRVETSLPLLSLEGHVWTLDGQTFQNGPAPLRPGRAVYLRVHGAGLESVPADGFSSSAGDLEIDPGEPKRGIHEDGSPTVTLTIWARPEAGPGARSLYVTRDDERAALTGVLEVEEP